MKRSQELEIEINKTRQLVVDAPSETTDEQMAEWRHAISFATEKRTVALEVEAEIQTAAEAVVAEQRQSEGHQDTETAETREVRGLAMKAEMRDFLQAASQGDGLEALKGVAHEFRAAVYGTGIGLQWMPLEMLLDPEERAATAIAAIQTNQNGIGARVFARSDLAFLGVATPTVPIGEAAYSYLATGVAPAPVNEGTAVDQTAATVTTRMMTPKRVGAQYLIGIETTGRVVGIESISQNDLRAALSDKIDDIALNGQTADPAIDSIISRLVASAALNLNSTGTNEHNVTVALWTAVDGKLAYRGDTGQVRMLCGVEAIQEMAGLVVGTSGGTTITDKYGENILRASSRIPAAVGSVQSFILHRVAATGRAIMPIWNGIAFIRDAASKAAEGQILVTAHMLIDFDLVRTDGHLQGQFDWS